MKILAIDSSALVASVAVVTEDELVAEFTINYKKTHSQTLLPMIDEITRMIELDINTIDAIAISGGPGSFTGLRIGSATAKGLGLALNKPLIHVPTLDGLAYNMFGTDALICPLMDAKRNQVYTGLYEFNNDKLCVVSENKAVDINEIIDEINKLNRKVVFLGDGVEVHRDVIKMEMQTDYMFAPPHHNKQRAGAIGALGIEYYKLGKSETATEHAPTYLRLSQAERELAEKNK